MCPLRFILVFLSAILAGYVAWRTASSSSGVCETTDHSEASETRRNDQRSLDLKRMIQKGFWVFVDMASGRYLWRNLSPSEKASEQSRNIM